jgi:cardiolipin synthase
MANGSTTVRRTGLVALAGAAVLAHRKVLRIEQHECWPPSLDAVTPEGAQAATAAFAARPRARPRDATLEFAWATAAELDPWVEGANFFPRILADVEAARASVHILMFGWREGVIGTRMAELLERKLADGVEVRVILDGLGSRPYGAAREMFTRLAAAGAQIVVNDLLPPDRDGLFPDGQSIDWRHDELGRSDHRKLYVVDGRVGWTGGAGLEDHFHDGRFHDVMVRITGDVVRQLQAAFLTAFHGYGGTVPSDLARHFPQPPDPGSTPVALAQCLPGGFVPATQAIREQIAGARERLDVMNPYVTDRGMLGLVQAAARRGVAVRLVVAERSNNGAATAALRRHYPDLLAAGVEIWELPGTVVHAKVVVADELVSFGTVNLDAWALYRNAEVMLLARSAELAQRFEERLFAPDIARCKRGEPAAGAVQRFTSRFWDGLAYYL